MEKELFKRTMKARGHWRESVMKSAKPAEPESYFRKDDKGSVTLIEPAKGYWVNGLPSSYTVTIYIAAPGTPLKDGSVSEAGHMWFGIKELKAEGPEVDTSYGFGPINHGILGPGVVVKTDTGKYINPHYSRTLEITMGRYLKLKEFGDVAVDSDEKYFSLYYSGVSNSCIDFTNAALRFAGLNPMYTKSAVTPSRADPIPYEDTDYEGALKVLDNIPKVKQIPAPAPNSELNKEHYNKMPERSVKHRLLSQQGAEHMPDGTIT